MFCKIHWFVLILALSACASAPSQNTKPNPTPATNSAQASIQTAHTDAPVDANLAPPDEIDKIISESNPVLAEMSGSDEHGEKVPLQIPLEINRKVAEWINFFAVRDKDRTERSLERGEPLRPHIQQLLKDNDVPVELFYLAMIESSFVSQARSRARAVGAWQFMRDTGRNYGLRVDSQVDERRNWIKATEAAASYLKDLNNVFGSWYLALAAYNAGEHRIVRSIMRGKTRDFWALAEAGLLPRETLNYVPKFLAAHIVGKNYKKYGLNVNPQQEDTWEDYDTVSVPSGARLSDIAKATGVSLDILKKWNADLIRGYTPYSKSGSVDIYVPKTLVHNIEENRLAIEKLKRVKVGPEKRQYASAEDEGEGDGDKVYVVRSGDSLYTISKRLGVSVRTLMKLNSLRRGRIHPGQRLRYYGANTAQVGKHRRLASGKKKSRKLAKSDEDSE